MSDERNDEPGRAESPRADRQTGVSYKTQRDKRGCAAWAMGVSALICWTALSALFAWMAYTTTLGSPE